MDQPTVHVMECDGIDIAYRLRPGDAPTLIFLPGYMSDMDGTKAQAVDDFAADQGLACLRFDYSGTGSSAGTFDDGTLHRWLGECLAVVDRLTTGPLILIGSSMGGWLALLIALQRTQRVKAIVGIAAAPDFTDWGFDEGDRERLIRDGKIEERDLEGAPGRLFTRLFWESAQSMLLLDGPIAIECPVRLIHGTDDSDVPPEVAHCIMRQLRSADVQLILVKGGGHRLSAPHEIAAILNATAALLEQS